MVNQILGWLRQLPRLLFKRQEDGMEQWKRLEFNKPVVRGYQHKEEK